MEDDDPSNKLDWITYLVWGAVITLLILSVFVWISNKKSQDLPKNVEYKSHFYDIHLAQWQQQPMPIYRTYATITGYSKTETCPNRECITASGEQAHISIVACPKWIPLGTLIEIEGMGLRKCGDRYADWIQVRNGNTFDLWFETHNEAMEFGKQKRWVEIF